MRAVAERARARAEEGSGRWPVTALGPELAARVRRVLPAVSAGDAEAERLRALPPQVTAALAGAGLFTLATPADRGGLALSPVAEMEVYEILARACTSAAWVAMTGSVYNSWAAAYLGAGAVEEVFGAGRAPVVAGQSPPRGRARWADGVLRVTGSYSFGSGMDHADWVLGGFALPDDVARRAGTPAGTYAFVVPRARVTVVDGWHAAGLSGSASVSFTVDDVAVPEGFSFRTDRVAPLRGGPRFAAPLVVQVAAGHCGVALGAAERALDLIVTTAGRVAPLRSRGTFQRDVGLCFTRLSAARRYVSALLTELDERLVTDGRLGRLFVQEVMAAETFVTQTAVEVAQVAFRHGGAPAVYLDSVLQRVLRDLLVAQQHKLVDDANYDALGITLVERDGGGAPRDDGPAVAPVASA